MNQFNLPSCSSEDVMRVKKDIKTKSNNKSVQAAYQSLFGDTQIAVSNIQECLNNPNDIEQRLSLIHNGDVSFADDIIGLTPRGNGASRYRAFLALNERDILEIRIGNHYETEKVALAKSNNKAQFLCQVVLITTPPQPESDDAITSTTSVGNLHVLTKKLISSNSSIDDLRNVLISIKDYLISPTKSYEDSINDNNNNDIKTENYMRNNKRTIRLTESDLHQIIEKAINEIGDTKRGQRMLGRLGKRKLDKRDWDGLNNVFNHAVRSRHDALGVTYDSPDHIRQKDEEMADEFNKAFNESKLYRIVSESVKRLLRESHDNGKYVSWAIDKLSSNEAIMSLIKYDFATLRVEVYANEHSGEVADRIQTSSIDDARNFIQQYQGSPMDAFLDFEVECANVLDLLH